MNWLSLNSRQDAGKDYGYRVITVLAEPITLAQAWRHLRIDVMGSPAEGPDDEWLTEIGIPAARDWCESYLGMAVAPQIIEAATNSFPYGAIPLAYGPVRAIDSIVYEQDDGAHEMDDDDYALNVYTSPNQVGTSIGAAWPAAVNYANSVRVRYFAGYGDFGGSPIETIPLPAGIRAAMLLTLGHLYENRESVVVNAGALVGLEVPNGAKALLERYRIRLSTA